MYKIVILGCENSHADAFLRIIENDKDFSLLEVVGVYSNDYEASKNLSEKYNVHIMENYDEFVGKVDGVVVTARHGDNHLKYVKPYLPSGIPVYMDKPTTIKIEDAVEMMAEFKKYGNKYTGGSLLGVCGTIQEIKNKKLTDGEKTVGGIVRAPIMMESEYGGFYFYAQHLVEMLCEVFGRFPESVIATKNKNGVSVVFKYAEYDVFGSFAEKMDSYYVVRMCEKNNYAYDIDMSGASEIELGKFYSLLKNEGTVMDEKEFTAPVYIMNAIEKSLADGNEVKISWER